MSGLQHRLATNQPRLHRRVHGLPPFVAWRRQLLVNRVAQPALHHAQVPVTLGQRLLHVLALLGRQLGCRVAVGGHNLVLFVKQLDKDGAPVVVYLFDKENEAAVAVNIVLDAVGGVDEALGDGGLHLAHSATGALTSSGGAVSPRAVGMAVAVSGAVTVTVSLDSTTFHIEPILGCLWAQLDQCAALPVLDEDALGLAFLGHIDECVNVERTGPG